MSIQDLNSLSAEEVLALTDLESLNWTLQKMLEFVSKIANIADIPSNLFDEKHCTVLTANDERYGYTIAAMQNKYGLFSTYCLVIIDRYNLENKVFFVFHKDHTADDVNDSYIQNPKWNQVWVMQLFHVISHKVVENKSALEQLTDRFFTLFKQAISLQECEITFLLTQLDHLLEYLTSIKKEEEDFEHIDFSLNKLKAFIHDTKIKAPLLKLLTEFQNLIPTIYYL